MDVTNILCSAVCAQEECNKATSVLDVVLSYFVKTKPTGPCDDAAVCIVGDYEHIGYLLQVVRDMINQSRQQARLIEKQAEQEEQAIMNRA